VKARSRKTAEDVLPRIRMVEDITPRRVSIRTGGVEGILLGVSFDVAYHVRVPAGARVNAENVNGELKVTGVTGQLTAVASNGTVTASGLRGGADIRTINGRITVQFAELGADPVSIRATNGAVDIAIPAAAGATFSASARNGEITTGDLPFDPMTEPERGRSPRMRGRINGGGTTIDVQTVNGRISIHEG
jgi:DUF4097 and DUF4098 domain-containing protein YvlB